MLILYEMECLYIEEYYKSWNNPSKLVIQLWMIIMWVVYEWWKNHIISDDLWLLWLYTNKVCDDMMNSMKSVRNQWISDPIEEKVYNHRINNMEWMIYFKYKWNGYEFSKKWKQLLETMNTIPKCQEAKLNRLMIIFDHKIDEDWLSDMIDSSLGYVSFL